MDAKSWDENNRLWRIGAGPVQPSTREFNSYAVTYRNVISPETVIFGGNFFSNVSRGCIHLALGGLLRATIGQSLPHRGSTSRGIGNSYL